MKKIFCTIFIFLCLHGFTQCKTYKLDNRGDTLNCIDNKDLKQGKWISKVDALRGEPGYQEIGFYKDNRKTGEWQTYS